MPLFPRWRKVCCTGYQLVTITVGTTYAGTPFTISAPPGKYMLDLLPYASWPPPLSGSVAPFVDVGGAPITVALPDGRVLPTGWSGTLSSSYLQPGSNPVPTNVTIRCINA
jgi:hypothetical protein